MYFKKVLIKDRLPELMKFVTTIDLNDEHRVYRLTEYGWNMRDADGDNSTNNNIELVYWLEEVNEKIEEKANNWDKLGKQIERCYLDEDGNELSEEDSEFIDLGTIGELAAIAYKWL